MKTQSWILPAVMQPRTVPAEGLTAATRTDALGRGARGIAILALVLGSIGAGAAATSGYGSSGHASAHQPAANIHLGHLMARPWMY
jgi:hypothetical protein